MLKAIDSLINKFNSFDKKVLIEIYVIVGLLFSIFLYFMYSSKPIEKISFIPLERYKGSISSFYKDINNEKFTSKLISSKLNKNGISLFFQGNKESLLKDLNFLENYNDFIHIKKLSLNLQNKKSKLDLYINLTKKHYKKERYLYEIQSKDIDELIEEKKSFKKKKIKQIIFNLDAIVFNKAIINKQLLEIGKNINGFKLIKIATDHVILQSSQKTIKVNLK